ncbi:MAG: molybdopterin molybdotransferase MoeA [Deltaproteobacteria bacterium]|nr:molybdopterin molybdotransferase MoeA [Deltaproteobacteria bacterium]
MITVESALETILKEIKPLDVESTGILSSLGRVLGEDIKASRPNPPWDNSAMDGYALKAEDLERASDAAPVSLNVIYDLPAGQVPKGPVKNGEAVRIMTGAPVPDGATAVVMVERTERGPGGTVLIKAAARTGENIRRAGEDFNAGETVIKSGALIRPAEVSMLATVGAPFVFVHKRPRVAVLSTGDELCDIQEVPPQGKISNSNGYALSALVAAVGAEPIWLGVARDTKESLREKLEIAMKADCIISSGGVSVGDYDFVKDVLKELGSEMIFWKVAMKPGKPLAFGVIGGKPAFGLPGNPISSMVAFEQFVKPALLKMAGRKAVFSQTFSALLTKDIKIKPGRMNFIRAELKMEEAGFEATPLDGQGSGVISTMVRANSFIIVPKDSSGFKAGETVKVQPFDPSILLREKAWY